jgi:hypothetical protein
MRFTLIVLTVISLSNAFGSGFSFGTGESWLEICSGENDDLGREGSVATCMMFISGFQAGAVEQSKLNNEQPYYCRELDPQKHPPFLT